MSIFEGFDIKGQFVHLVYKELVKWDLVPLTYIY